MSRITAAVPRPTITGVLAALALFIALGGASIASPAVQSAKKLITGKQIKDSSIAERDLSRAVRKKLAKTGATGPAGPAGAAGVTGATGAAGASAATEHGYFYNSTTPAVADNAGIPLDTNGDHTAAFTHTVPASTVTVSVAGKYRVAFSVTAGAANQVAVVVNGSFVSGSLYGVSAANQQNDGQVVVSLAAGDTVGLRNLTGGSITLATFVGAPGLNVNASMLIEKLD